MYCSMTLHIKFCVLSTWLIQNIQIIPNLKLYYTPFLLKIEQFKILSTVKLNDPALLIAQHKKQWVLVNMLRHKKQSQQLSFKHGSEPNDTKEDQIRSSPTWVLAFSVLMIRRIFSTVINCISNIYTHMTVTIKSKVN